MPQEAGDSTQHAKDAKTEESPQCKGKVRYKYCIVPLCRSTTTSTPQKLFFSVPTGEPRRRWCEAMGRRAPRHQPLSPVCNRFCCEDHFDLEKDMENYIKWKLMGKKVTKKLLKRGVIPHKFDCQGAQHNTPPALREEEKSRKELIEEILEEARKKEMQVTLDQRLKEEKKSRVNTKKRQRTVKEKSQRKLKVRKLVSEEEQISQQRKKIERITHVPQATEVTSHGRLVETYTFEIKIEVEDDLESNDGNSILEDIYAQDCNTSVQDNTHLLDVNIKVEELDEEFEPEIVEVDIQGNIVKDLTDATVTTEVTPDLTDETNPLKNESFSVISDNNKKDDDFEQLSVEEKQVTKERTNPIGNETNSFVRTENIRDKKVFERVIIGKQMYENVED